MPSLHSGFVVICLTLQIIFWVKFVDVLESYSKFLFPVDSQGIIMVIKEFGHDKFLIIFRTLYFYSAAWPISLVKVFVTVFRKKCLLVAVDIRYLTCLQMKVEVSLLLSCCMWPWKWSFASCPHCSKWTKEEPRLWCANNIAQFVACFCYSSSF